MKFKPPTERNSDELDPISLDYLGDLTESDGNISECEVNGKAMWINSFPDSSAETQVHYGHPYISCFPPRDVVGPKKAILTVGDQSVVLPKGLINSRCYTELINGNEFKYYGT